MASIPRITPIFHALTQPYNALYVQVPFGARNILGGRQPLPYRIMEGLPVIQEQFREAVSDRLQTRSLLREAELNVIG